MTITHSAQAITCMHLTAVRKGTCPIHTLFGQQFIFRGSYFFSSSFLDDDAFLLRCVVQFHSL